MSTGGTGEGAHDDEGGGAASAAVARVKAPIDAARRVFGVVGDTRRRRRPSDGVRLVGFLALVGLILVFLDSGAGPDERLADAILPLPSPWAGAAEIVFWAAPLLAAVLCLVVAILGKRWAIGRDVVLSVLAAAALVAVLQAVFGDDGGRPDDASLAAAADFPTAILCIAVGAASVAGPYLTRPTRRLVVVLVFLGAVAALLSEQSMPIAVVASVLVGWAAAAAVHLAVGSPAGFPSRSEVAASAAGLGVPVDEVERAAHQRWGVARFVARAEDGGERLGITVYGRDASDAQFLSTAWHFLWYRDSGPSVALSRQQQVEHQAVATMLAARSGAAVPEVLAVGTAPSTDDALLISRTPAGVPLAEVDPADVSDAALDDAFRQLHALHGDRIAHGAIDADHVLVEGDHVALVGFEDATTSAPDLRLDQDTAQLLVALAVEVDEDRAVASALRMLGAERLEQVLPQVQGPVLERGTRKTLPDKRKFLGGLRDRAAQAGGFDAPKVAEVRRVSATKVALVAATGFGFWLLVSELAGMGDVWSTIAEADWTLVALALLVSQLTQVAQSYALVGAVQGGLPFGPVVSLQFGLAFTGLVGGTVANTATIVRFFQTRGLAASVAVSSGVLVSISGFVVQAFLFVFAWVTTASDFTFARTGGDSSSDGSDDAQLILVAIIVVGVLAGIVFGVPKLRRWLVGIVKPQLEAATTNLKAIARDPRKLAHLFFGNLLSQVLFATALSICLHAYGQSASLPALILVNTMASLFGGLAPVPGGMGVVEASLIAGLTAYGIPSSEAAAAVLTYRMCTCYLPPAWGYPNLMWLRKRAYL
jgi:uncharacterized membrane protein YbhN (UPF0104 family)